MTIKTISREVWFGLVNQVCPMWGRLTDNTLTASFSGYKCENYHIAQEALLKAGGIVMSDTWDSIGGRTYVTIKEPMGLESPEE